MKIRKNLDEDKALCLSQLSSILRYGLLQDNFPRVVFTRSRVKSSLEEMLFPHRKIDAGLSLKEETSPQH